MDDRGKVNAKSGYRDRIIEGYVNREEWQVIKDNAVNRFRQNVNIDKTMAHSKQDIRQTKTMTIGRYSRQAVSPVNWKQDVLLGSGSNPRQLESINAPGTDHLQQTPKDDYYSTCVTLPRPMISRTNTRQVYINFKRT